jgi:hypothetical protein
MSDSNTNRKTAARQANQEQASHYELARAYTGEGLQKTALKYGEISQNSTPHTWAGAAAQAGQAAYAGRKDYAKSAYHAGMGFMEGVSRQNPNSGQQLNSMKINQSIAQGRYQQDKVNSAKQESQQKTSLSTNKGIAAYQSKASGQSTGSSNSSSGQSKGSGQSR